MKFEIFYGERSTLNTVIETLVEFAKVYRDEVREDILYFEKSSVLGEVLDLKGYNYIGAPTIKRIE